MKRRSFLRGLLGIAGLSAVGGIASVQKQTKPRFASIERSSFIKTDETGNIVKKETFGQSIPADPRIIRSQKQINAFCRKFIDNAIS